MLTQAELKSRLYYDHETGLFEHLTVNLGPNKSPAGHLSKKNGYRRIRVNGHLYLAHHLAWLYVTGELPAVELDHRNGVRDDNRIGNLRRATRQQNIRNSTVRCDSKTGLKGVDYHKASRKWRARCWANEKRHLIGYFDTPERASEAYQAFAREHHGEFFRDTIGLDLI